MHIENWYERFCNVNSDLITVNSDLNSFVMLTVT